MKDAPPERSDAAPISPGLAQVMVEKLVEHDGYLTRIEGEVFETNSRLRKIEKFLGQTSLRGNEVDAPPSVTNADERLRLLEQRMDVLADHDLRVWHRDEHDQKLKNHEERLLVLADQWIALIERLDALAKDGKK